jgi:hypothetical protein
MVSCVIFLIWVGHKDSCLWNTELDRWWPCCVLLLFKFTIEKAAFQCGVECSNIAFIPYTTDVWTFLHHSHRCGPPHICLYVITLVRGGRTKHTHCRWMVWCSKVHKRSMATETLDGWASWRTQGMGLQHIFGPPQGAALVAQAKRKPFNNAREIRPATNNEQTVWLAQDLRSHGTMNHGERCAYWQI